jgi:hypothetical protein
MTLGCGKRNKPDIEGDDIWLMLVLLVHYFIECGAMHDRSYRSARMSSAST